MVMEATEEKWVHANQNWAKQAMLWFGFHSGLQMEFLVNAQDMISFSSITGKLSEEFSISH